MTQDILKFAEERVSIGKPVAMVFVTKTTGSSPASVGQFMVVLEDGSSRGTVGGGKTEYLIIEKAVKAIKNCDKVFEFSFDHSKEGMVCGGGMQGYGNIIGNEDKLFIFGGGHIAQSLAPLARATGFSVTVIEDRSELEESFRDIKFLTCTPDEYAKQINISSNSYIVICTRGHMTDDEALRFSLKFDAKYIGMIGSKKKVLTLFSQLEKENYDAEALSKVYAPIGLNVASSVPAEIAVSIVAEMLLIKNGGKPSHKKLEND